MTVLNTGSTKKYSANWEDIFSKGKSKKKPTHAAQSSPAAGSSGKKKSVAKAKAAKKASKSRKEAK